MPPRRKSGAGPVRLLRASSTPVVVTTIVLLFVVYLLTGFAANFVAGGEVVADGLILEAPAVLQGEVWRLASYGLLHSLAHPLHLLFNALFLWFFARDLELRFGQRWLALLFMTAVVVGGLAVVTGWLLGIGKPTVLGFSAAAEASAVTWALFNRDRPVMVWFAVPARGIHMLGLAVVMWLLDAVSVSAISASAHLGGIVVGIAAWFLTVRRNRLRLLWDELLAKLRLRRGPRLTVVPKPDRWVN